MRQKISNNENVKKKRSTTLVVILSIIFTLFLTCVIVGTYVLHDVISTVHGECLIDMEFYRQNQDQTTIIYANDSENNPVELIRLHGAENRVWVSRDDMSPWIGKAFVSLEDKRFRDHKGVDWTRTILGVVKSGFSQGGSTITQQLIKNLTGESGRTINRKYNEILSALNMEKSYSKDEILEAYLNTIYLSHGCYGVKTASEVYFGKDIKDLNLAECATLAAITQYPGEYDPLWNPKKNKFRQEYCLKSMYEQGVISKEEYEEAVNYKLIFTNSPEYVDSGNLDDKNTNVKTEIQSYYVDYVIDSVIRDLKANGYSHYEATKMIYSGGLRIYSAIDTRIQGILEDVFVNRINFPKQNLKLDEEPYQSSMVIMDYEGRIVAMVGGAGHKTENRSNNRAVSAIRQPGSVIKPLSIYAPAMEENYITWSSKIKNYGITWKGKRWPSNYGNDPGAPDSYVTAQFGLSISYNTVPAQILMMMGFKTSYDYLKNHFHLTALNDRLDSQAPSALATGGTNGGVTTLQMAAAFATFGNGGKYYKPYVYYKVTDSSGKDVILQNNPEPESVLSPETADIMNLMLRTVVTGSSGTGRAYGVNGFTTYLKTGTTSTVSGNTKDKWLCGGTPYYIASVWFGDDYNMPLKGVGSNPAGKIFKTVMDRVHKGLSTKNFDSHSDKVVQRTYCTVSGLLAGDGCSSKATGWYNLEKLPGTCAGCVRPSVEPSTNEGETTPSGETTTAPQTGEVTTVPVPTTVTATTPQVAEEAN